MKTEATVKGVYLTAHTTGGELTSGPPSRVSIDCESVTFEFVVSAPFDGRIESTTLHFGVLNTTHPGTGTRFYNGAEITLTQTMLLDVMNANHGRPPVWIKA